VFIFVRAASEYDGADVQRKKREHEKGEGKPRRQCRSLHDVVMEGKGRGRS
jgi:hypothetical protein